MLCQHRLFQREDGVKVGGHHEDAGCRAVIQPAQHALGVEARQELKLTAEEDRGNAERQARAVAQRRESQEPVVGRIAAVLGRHAVEGENPRPMGHEHALGLTGRSGGIGNGEGLPLPHRRQVGPRPGAGQPALQVPRR